MKTPLMYGFLMALVNMLVTFGQYFAGFHDTPEKLARTQWVSIVVGLAVGVTFSILAIRARRTEYPPSRPWTYGSALGTGVVTGVFSALFNSIFGYVYFALINPQFSDMLYQLQVSKMEAKGLSSEKIAQAEGIMRTFVSPVAITIAEFVQVIFWCVIFSLIIAAFLRRRPAPLAGTLDTPPPMA